ncbi:MAG: hypothetical protein IJU27_07455 [Bacteroidales bacterium]|nr:hypothetical protein [Bacteroidales bacterium]
MLYAQIIKLFNHDTAFNLMKSYIRFTGRFRFLRGIHRLSHLRNRSTLPSEVFNISFGNPIGIGPGLDPNGQLYNTLSDYGYSFAEIGPVGPGNVMEVINNLRNNPPDPIIAILVSKDHARTFSLAYDFADMFVIEAPDNDIMDIMEDVLDTRLSYETYKPVLVRIMHDFPESQLREILGYCQLNGVDGAVVAKPSNVRKVVEITGGRFPVIGYGGIRTPESAKEMLDAGASLMEITTGLVLDGPDLITKLLDGLRQTETRP